MENAEEVARHLVMIARVLDDDPARAMRHAEVAARRAGRVAAVREAVGLVSYRLGDFDRAAREFRTVRRMSGSDHVVAQLADCERALGRPERAISLIKGVNTAVLDAAERVELSIVEAGARRDLGQLDAAVVVLRELTHRRLPAEVAVRVCYAYADAVLAQGDRAEARHWFGTAAELDEAGATDAAERIDDLDGVTFLSSPDDVDDTDDGDDTDDVDDTDEMDAPDAWADVDDSAGLGRPDGASGAVAGDDPDRSTVESVDSSRRPAGAMAEDSQAADGAGTDPEAEVEGDGNVPAPDTSDGAPR